MHLLLTRTVFSPAATIGVLALDGQPFCHVLEDVVRPAGQAKIFGRTAIPAGSYGVVITYSTRFRQPMPLLLQVPGYEGVRIHSGNSAADTEGCLLVGTYDPRRPDWVSNSRATYAGLFARLQAARDAGQSLRLTIK